MLRKRRILFLYMVPETGHQKAAEAIMQAASAMDPFVECIGIDGISQVFPLIGNAFNRVYLQMIQRAPGIWDYLYDNPNVEEVTRDARELLTQLSLFRTKKILKRYQPEIVVCTQAAPAISLAALKRKGQMKVPLVCVITDFGVHTYWYHDEVDLYLVGHDDVRQEMIRRGIRPERIRVTGIPISPKFGESNDSIGQRLRLRLNPHKKTILVMGGSRGLGGIEEIVDGLKTIPYHYQAVVVCGKNKKLQRKILEATHNWEDFYVMGFVKDISALMTAADILISKPGGLTTSEALAKQLPMILTNPIPGQEERNVEFLTRRKVAKVVRTKEEMIHALGDLLKHPKKLQQMRQRARLMARPYSAWEAARIIFGLISKWPSTL